MVRENGTSKPLQGDFSWGSESPAGKRLAMALLKDALEDDKRATDLADIFNSRVISILPDRWTLTRERIVSHANVMARDQISNLLLIATAPGNSKPADR